MSTDAALRSSGRLPRRTTLDLSSYGRDFKDAAVRWTPVLKQIEDAQGRPHLARSLCQGTPSTARLAPETLHPPRSPIFAPAALPALVRARPSGLLAHDAPTPHSYTTAVGVEKHDLLALVSRCVIFVAVYAIIAQITPSKQYDLLGQEFWQCRRVEWVAAVSTTGAMLISLCIAQVTTVGYPSLENVLEVVFAGVLYVLVAWLGFPQSWRPCAVVYGHIWTRIWHTTFAIVISSVSSPWLWKAAKSGMRRVRVWMHRS